MIINKALEFIKEKQMYDIFISYRRSNLDSARLIAGILKNNKFDVFFDFDDIKDGNYGDKIKNAINEAPIFIMVLSDDYISKNGDNDWVQKEVSLALEKKRQIIPINPNARFNKFSDLESLVGTIQVSNLDFQDNFTIHIETIITNRILPHLTEQFKKQALEYEHIGEWNNAINSYKRIQSPDADTTVRLILCHLHLTQIDAAQKVAREAIQNYSKNPDVLFAVALVNLAINNYHSDFLERATKLLIQACELEKKNEYHCLAFIISFLYNKQSYRVPNGLQQLTHNVNKEDIIIISELAKLIGLKK